MCSCFLVPFSSKFHWVQGWGILLQSETAIEFSWVERNGSAWSRHIFLTRGFSRTLQVHRWAAGVCEFSEILHKISYYMHLLDRVSDSDRSLWPYPNLWHCLTIYFLQVLLLQKLLEPSRKKISDCIMLNHIKLPIFNLAILDIENYQFYMTYPDIFLNNFFAFLKCNGVHFRSVGFS